jgi:ATP-binding cassette, subfamily B, multidrug efflux pump
MRRPGDIQSLAALEPEKAKRRAQVGRRLVGELRPHASTLSLSFVFIVVQAACASVAPILVKRAIDRDIGSGDGRGLLRTVAILFGVYLVGAGSTRAQVRRVGVISQHVLADLRGRLFGHLLKLPLGYFDRRPIGDLMSRLLSDVETLSQLTGQMTQVTGALFALAGIMIAMLAEDVRLAMACFLIIPAMVLTTWFFGARARKAYRKTRETVGDVTANLQEEIVGVRQAQAFNRTERNIQKFRDRNAANRDANVQATGITSAFSPTIEMLATLATALVIGYGGMRVLDRDLTVGVVAAFLLWVSYFFRPVQLAAATYTLMQSALAGAERIYEVLDEAPEPQDVPGAKELQRAEGRIELRDVSFSYDPLRPVLHGVSFTVPAGQTVALVGKTGAGKTTVASLVPRLYDATSGAVLLDGVDVRELTRRSLRKQMAMVLQEPFLFSGSIHDNIAYGKPGAAREEVEAAAKAVHAHEVIAALPKGYDTVIGESGATLSQGQKQLLAFARAVIAEPRVLILDEATANIDTRTESLIQMALGKLLAGRTSIVIAHRLSTIRTADQILVIDQGKVAEQGTHDELMARAGLYAELYARQFVEPAAAREAVA